VVSSWRRVWEPEQRGEGNILCTGNPSAPFECCAFVLPHQMNKPRDPPAACFGSDACTASGTKLKHGATRKF